MAEQKEKTVQRSYRLPAADVEVIDLLAKKGILGANSSAVVRTLLSAAIKDLIEKEYPQKHEKTLEFLKNK